MPRTRTAATTRPAAAPAHNPLRLGYQLRLADRALRQAFEEQLRPLGLNWPQTSILLFIDRFPGVSMARLATVATVTPQTIHRTVTTLLKRALVRRVDKPGDRKSFGLQLTPGGKARLAEGEAVMRAVQDGVNATFKPAELKTLFELLTRYEAALSEKPRT